MRLVLFAAVLLFAGPAFGQVAVGDEAPGAAISPIPSEIPENRVAELLAQRETFAGIPEVGPREALSEETLAALDAAFAAYYAYRESGYAHRRGVFEWQLFSSKIIFGVVIAVVAVGLYFSWLQFMATRRTSATRAAREGEPTSTFKASLQGVEVSSPVLGVIILAISLVFFYLYLVHVYPITEVP